MNRRRFLGAMLGGVAAPAIVKAEHLMKIAVPKQEIILPFKLRHQNGISGAYIGDMDINDMYDRIIPVYDRPRKSYFFDSMRITRGTGDLCLLGYDERTRNLGVSSMSN